VSGVVMSLFCEQGDSECVGKPNQEERFMDSLIFIILVEMF
jgi:hypothetical protein